MAEVLTETATVPAAVETGAATTGVAAGVTEEGGVDSEAMAAETPSSEFLSFPGKVFGRRKLCGCLSIRVSWAEKC